MESLFINQTFFVVGKHLTISLLKVKWRGIFVIVNM
jgi:hypothetical protein